MMGTVNPARRDFARSLIRAERIVLGPPLVIDGGWALVAPPFSVIDHLHAISRAGGARQWTAIRLSEDIKADPGAGVAGDLRGRAVFRSGH